MVKYCCDRCGAQFQKQKFESLNFPKLIIKEAIGLGDIKEIDLCESCKEDFRNWFENK